MTKRNGENPYLYNTNADLDGEISRFLTNKKDFIDRKGHRYKINKKERIILEKILKKNKNDKLIARKTSKNNLERLKSSIIISSATKYVRNRINRILNLKNKRERIKNIEKFNNEEIKNFAAMVKAEAGGEIQKGKIAVAYVILNRMKFGHKSLNKVLFKRTRAGKSEFSPIDDGRFKQIRNNLNNKDIKLIKDIISGKISNPIGNATFFERSDLVNSWHKKSVKSGKLRKVKTIGNHTFYAIINKRSYYNRFKSRSRSRSGSNNRYNK